MKKEILFVVKTQFTEYGPSQVIERAILIKTLGKSSSIIHGGKEKQIETSSIL